MNSHTVMNGFKEYNCIPLAVRGVSNYSVCILRVQMDTTDNNLQLAFIHTYVVS